MEIVVTPRAVQDLNELPEKVRETFYNSKETAEANMELGASPRMAFDKYLSGDMHPILQETLGSDYRAWFVEGEQVADLDDAWIYCIRVLTAKEAHRIEDGPTTAREVLRRAFG